jgi:ParB family chromosome partitioning protein
VTAEEPRGRPERGGAFRGRGGLGRGLGALIPETPTPVAAETGETAEAGSTAPRGGPVTVDVDLIAPNPQQPRTAIDPEVLATLTESVRQHGVLQPLVVSREQTPGGAVAYRLIAGERRLHAARAAGLRRVPVVVREATPQQQLELALVENIQRADLNPLEEASAFQRLTSEFALTQEELARRVGRSRAAVANTLRLLSLADEIKASLAAGEISEGHARALLGVENVERRRALWQQVRERGLSVRQTEALVRALREQATQAKPAPRPARRDPELASWEERLRGRLGTAVQIDRGRRGGKLVISFYSDEELDGLLRLLLPDEEE